MASELAAALAKVQAELPHIAKGETANTGSYSYDYADLTAVSAAIMPLLGKHGLAFIAKPTAADGKFVLAYSLLHSSGEREDGEYPLPDKGTPQQLGGHITYARRYCLCAVTGVAPGGEDNDAAGATEVNMDRVRTAWTDPEHTRLRQPSPEERVNGRQAERRRGPDPDDPWATALPADADQAGSVKPVQMRKLQAILSGLFSKGERDQRLAAAEQIIGRELTGPNEGRTSSNLSFTEAEKLLGELTGVSREDLIERLALATGSAS